MRKIIYTCDVCGKKMETAKMKFFSRFILFKDGPQDINQINKRYDDICKSCTKAIEKIIKKRKKNG